MQLILSKEHRDVLSSEAINKKPNESCALLFGKKDTEKTTVIEVYLTENIEKSPVNFTISNEQLICGYKIAEEKGLDVIGIFHSHPDSEAYPSATDKKFMETNPVVWVIYSVMKNDFKAFIFETELISIQLLT